MRNENAVVEKESVVRSSRFRLRVGRLPRLIIYRPLAVALATILLLPSISWLESRAGIELGPSAAAFQATAQTSSPCTASTNQIIRTLCPGGAIYSPDLDVLESDAVNAYLGAHNLPASDAQVIYSEGRTDLRNAVRALMFSTLLGIITKPASARTSHEQRLYQWLQGLVQQNEIAEYTSAINAYHAWQTDPCDFTLDPTIAAQYGLSYDGLPFCYPLSQLFGGPPVPAESYFIAYGLKNSYGQPAQSYPNFGSLVAQTGLSLGEVAGIGAAAAAIAGAGAAAAIAASTSAALAVWTEVFATTESVFGGLAQTSAFFVVSGAAVSALGSVALAAGPVSIIILAIVSGVIAGFQTFSNQQVINDLNNLSSVLTYVTNTPPDLNRFATDSSNLDMLKLNETFVAQTLPDVPSTAALPAHQPTDPQFFITSADGTTTNGSPTVDYQDWNGLDWSARLYGGWFVQTCNSGTKCAQADSILASIQYVDGSGTKWTASRLGNKFVSTKLAPASTDQPCSANELSGVSSLKGGSCSSYVSLQIPLRGASGNQIYIMIGQAPQFTSSSTAAFTTGQSSTITITATGIPAPNISFSGTVPSGLTFTPGTGTASLTYTGSGVADGTILPVTLAASNTSGQTTQNLSMTFRTAPQITSSNNIIATFGVPLNFLVTTTGTLPMTLSNTEFLPPGFTFTDNGNGTATISGTATPTLVIPLSLCTNFNVPGFVGITATNSVGSTLQCYFLSFQYQPSARLVSSNATFVAGVQNSMAVRSTGAVTPVTYVFNYGAPLFGTAPAWLSFHDNGDGTGVLSGTPPEGTSGSYSFELASHALNSDPADFQGPLFSSFTLNVNPAPVFTSPSVATFPAAGTAGSFEIATNGGDVSLLGTLPQGLTFNAGNPASITGTAATGTGGQYNLLLTDDAGSFGTTSQQLMLNIYEAPQITSANSAIFYTGMPGSFAVTTTGYPSVSTQPVSQNSTPPSGPTEGQGMYFTVTGLPSDLQFSNLNAQGLATGTLTIQGTPSQGDAGVHQVQITAQNGVGIVAQQTLMLDIIKITAPAPASSSTCNGTYNGTFKGSITVSAGQNCMFVEGGKIAGSVTQNGGNFAIVSGIIGGNVQIQGAAAFSVGPQTTINGNVAIQNVASGSTTNQFCGAKILGTVQAIGNATPFQLGSASPESCPGNFVGGNLAVNKNTAAVAVYNNDVTKNLSCGSNTSITGAGNMAASKQGQCAAF